MSTRQDFPPTGNTATCLEQLAARADLLHAENESLGRELLRCYEQLNIVFEITRSIANARDAGKLRELLVKRLRAMLNADVVLLLTANGVSVTHADDGPVNPRVPSTQLICAALQPHIRPVQESRHVRVLPQDALNQAGAPGTHVLMAALHEWRDEPDVVIALRLAEAPPFDSSDMLAAESILGYGGQVLSNLLMMSRLQRMAVDTVSALANAIDAKDNYTSGHSQRVAFLARLTGAEMGMPEPALQELEWAGLLHDVGKIGIPERILNKPGLLTPEERKEIERHPAVGYEMLRPIDHFEPVLNAVLFHHENHDGSGYPHHRVGDDIPLAARIIHVVDVFDALTSNRTYRPGFSLEAACDILRSDSGRVTDPVVTALFLRAFERYQKEQPEDYKQRFEHLFAASSKKSEGEVAGG